MANGEGSAKEMLIEEADQHITQLTNGHASDPEKHGHAIAFVIRILKPMIRADFVTRALLEDRLLSYRTDCPVHRVYVDKKKEGSMRFSLGPVSWQGAASNLGITVVVAVFFIGKGKGWW